MSISFTINGISFYNTFTDNAEIIKSTNVLRIVLIFIGGGSGLDLEFQILTMWQKYLFAYGKYPNHGYIVY